jgi:hypothetical protein
LRTVADGEAVLSARVARQVIADSLGNYVRAVLCNGLGRYEDAVVAARQATDYPEDLGFFSWGLVEVIEAAALSGKVKLAADGLDRLSQTTTVRRQSPVGAQRVAAFCGSSRPTAGSCVAP